MRKGYLTVYLSLTLVVLMSLLVTLFAGVKISGSKMKTSVVADIAMKSALSEYNRELFKQYDLLFTDMSYGDSEGKKENVENRLKYYLIRNLDESAPDNCSEAVKLLYSNAVIEEYSLATDNNAEALRYQVYDYMSNFGGDSDFEYTDISGELESAGCSYDVEAKRAEVQSRIDEIGLPVIINDEGLEEEVPLGNPADNVNGIRGAGVLGIVLDNPSDISEVVTDTTTYASSRTLKSADGLSTDEREAVSFADPSLYARYMFNKYGCWGKEKEDSLLQYQIEYVINGHGSDWDNLEGVCETIAFWREAAAFTYLMGDFEKQAEAEALASSLAAVVLLPELTEPVKWSILLAWSYVEALQDVKILLEDGAVLTVKTAQSWHTSLTDILSPVSAMKHYPLQEGAKYGDYLNTILLSQAYSDTLFKSMDIMEMDIRKTPGNAKFRMDNCMHGFLVYIEIQNSFGRKIKVRRRNGYYYS